MSIVGTGTLSVVSATATEEAVTITVKDLSRLFVRMYNTNSTLTALTTVSAGDDPDVAYGISTLVLACQPEDAVYWGGSMDSSRFKTTSGTIILTTDLSADGVTFEVGELAKY
jgi:hypothetical protein